MSGQYGNVRKVKKVYIAGPMSGYPEFNFPAFHAAAAKLREEGWTVFNPAENDLENGVDNTGLTGHEKLDTIANFDFRKAYLWDVTKVIEADAIYMLPGWEMSPGARGEHAVAVAMQRTYPEYQIIYEGVNNGEYRAAA